MQVDAVVVVVAADIVVCNVIVVGKTDGDAVPVVVADIVACDDVIAARIPEDDAAVVVADIVACDDVIVAEMPEGDAVIAVVADNIVRYCAVFCFPEFYANIRIA